MNDKIISELRKELDLLEYGTDPDKHIYAMQRLLAVIENDEEGHKEVQKTLGKEESTPLGNIQEPDRAGGRGQDIFDF